MNPPVRRLQVVDSHTCGQPTRVIITGASLPPGADPGAAREELRTQRDWVRRVAVMEPRGHRSMFAAALIPPVTSRGDFGVVYMDSYGYPNMCGHATIGVVTTLFEEGFIPGLAAGHPADVDLALLTPAGRVELRAHLAGEHVESVAFRIPMAYYLGPVDIRVRDVDKTAELAYGGQWYAFIDVAGLGIGVERESVDELVRMSVAARAEIERNIDLSDPMTGTPPHPVNVVWVDSPRRPDADARNVAISPAGSFDRSPCGTATCARMAALMARGQLAVGDPFINEGLMGTVYRGRAVAEATRRGITGIVAEVAGSAWVTGRSELTVDPRDPLGDGYLVGGGPAIGGAALDNVIRPTVGARRTP